VQALAFDSSGNLYAGGDFDSAGGYNARNIAIWNGSSWYVLGSGIGSSTDTCLSLAFRSGLLYAGGDFPTAGGISAINIAVWNGTSWSAVGGGTSGGNPDVEALAFDSLGNLYAVGGFTSPASRLARWNSTSWSSVDGGLSAFGRSISIDSSDNSYVGGSFSSPGQRVAVYASFVNLNYDNTVLDTLTDTNKVGVIVTNNNGGLSLQVGNSSF